MTFSLTPYDWFVLLCLMFIANLALDAIRIVVRFVYLQLTRKRRFARFVDQYERRQQKLEERRKPARHC